MKPIFNKPTLDVYELGIRNGYKQAAAAIMWDAAGDTRPGFQEHASELAQMLLRAADDSVSPDD